jgi:hypothetical protein
VLRLCGFNHCRQAPAGVGACGDGWVSDGFGDAGVKGTRSKIWALVRPVQLSLGYSDGSSVLDCGGSA